MAAQFNTFGLPARAVHGGTSLPQRQQAIADLRSGVIKVIFSVDLFNEGVDIPELNTLLLLRPSQSPVLFVQQLGRGLRLSHGKDACVVLDFIGQQNNQFDFTERYQALTKKRGTHLIQEIEAGFRSMPAGSNISLDRVTQEQVLKNIRNAASSSLKKIKALAADINTTDLSEFLAESGIPISDLYKTRSSNQYSWPRPMSSIIGPVSPGTRRTAGWTGSAPRRRGSPRRWSCRRTPRGPRPGRRPRWPLRRRSRPADPPCGRRPGHAPSRWGRRCRSPRRRPRGPGCWARSSPPGPGSCGGRAGRR